MMRYIVTLFWSLILGQVVGFIGAKLSSTAYAFIPTVLVSVAIALVIITLDYVMSPKAHQK